MKKSVSIFLALLIICSAFTVSGSVLSAAAASAGRAKDGIIGGTVNETVFWSLDTESGVFTVSGSGDFTCSPLPYTTYKGLIKSVDIKSGITRIGYSAFSICDELVSVNIPDTVISIGDSAFSECNNLAEITIPESVRYIGPSAFSYCDSLVCVNIPEGVTEIGYNAFAYCDNLSSVSLPDSLKKTGENVFIGTPLYNDESKRSDGFLYIGKHLINVKTDVAGARTVRPGTLTVADCAFKDCVDITSIILPDSLTDIGQYAFRNCSSLVYMAVPDSVTVLGNCAFQECENLLSVSLGSGVKVLSGTFYLCRNLTRVTCGDLTEIGVGAFRDCYYLASFTIPETVTTIGSYAFLGCQTLTSINIPDSVTEMGVYVFYFCEKLTEIKIGCNSVFYNEMKSVYKTRVKAVHSAAGEVLTGVSEDGKTVGRYRLCEKCGEKVFEDALNTVPGATTLCEIANTNRGVKISWNYAENADGYYIYRKAGTEKNWTRIASVGITECSYTDKSAKSGTVYTYTVRAANIIGGGAFDKNGLKSLYLAQPAVKTVNKNGFVNISWSKVSGAKGYNVYRKAPGQTNWIKIAAVKNGSTVTFDDHNTASGSVYTYTVRAVNASAVSSFCSGVSIRYIAAGRINSAVSTKAGITLKWSKTAGANGYLIYRKTGTGKWQRIAAVKGNASLTCVDRTAVKGKTYTYCVLPCSGNFAGVYANTVTCQAKK